MIVDASVFLRWFLNEPGAASAAAVFTQSTAPIAPELILAEVGNGLWKAARQKRIDQATAGAYLSKTPTLLGQLHPLSTLHAAALDISMQLDHPIYDCFYLALADEMHAPLLTTDAKLQTRVTGTKWRNLVSVLSP